ncbi:MAG: COX15/CtaA family protein [Burkholderiaceae bacterium]|nr:COX15/CtaA family protein [Burkholderiaceae bacterium]
MTSPDPRLRMLRRTAALCAVLMLLTIGLSAFMRLSMAGLGCTDWPACYGQGLRDPSVGGAAVAAARLAHRVVASLALVLAIVLVWLSAVRRPVLRREAVLAAMLLALALALAVLGLMTPGARAPAVAMGNLLGGFGMLALCWRLATPSTASGLGSSATVVLVLLCVQAGLGALLSASYSALSCTGLADCGRVAQATGWDWSVLNPWRDPLHDGVPPRNRAGALTVWLHSVAGLVTPAALGWLAVKASRRGRRRDAAVLLVLAALQVALGLLLQGAGLPITLVLAHNLVAAVQLAWTARLA